MKYCSFSNRTSNKITTPSLAFPMPTPKIDRDMLSLSFCRKFNSPKFSFEESFDVSKYSQ